MMCLATIARPAPISRQSWRSPGSRGDQNQEWEALIELGALWAASDYSSAGPLFQEAFDIARDLDDDRKIAHSLNRLGNWHINIGNPEEARNAHRKALDIFQRLSDPAGLAETLDLLGLASYLTADYVASASSLRQAIEIFRERNDARGLTSSLLLLAMSGGALDHGTSPAAAGRPDEWPELACEALNTAREIGWRAGEAFALLVLGTACSAHGNPGAGLEALRQARDLACKIGHHQWSIAADSNLGTILADLLQLDDARELLTDALERARVLGSAYWIRSVTSYLAGLYIEAGETEPADTLLSEALERDSSLDSAGQRMLWYQQARLALARNAWTEGLEIVESLLATAPGRQSDEAIPALSLLRGQLLAGQNAFEAAAGELQAGEKQASIQRDYTLLWRLYLALAAAHLAGGDERQADAALEQARATIDQIAEGLPDDDLRRTFLSRVETLLTRTIAAVTGPPDTHESMQQAVRRS